MWAAGSEFRDLAALREAPCGNGAPDPGLALDPAVAALITDGIAVNSTAELRASADGAHPAAEQGCRQSEVDLGFRLSGQHSMWVSCAGSISPLQQAQHAATTGKACMKERHEAADCGRPICAEP